jgi:hypothetical protein
MLSKEAEDSKDMIYVSRELITTRFITAGR